MAAPQLHTISELIDNNTLPLLVQQKSGSRLLLHKSIRLPYVVCQTLGSTNNIFFLIPLNNKGFYGAVSRHDEPTNAYSTLSQILQPTQSDSIEILIDNVTPIRLLDTNTNKFISKVLLPGEVIHVVQNKRCPLLEESGNSVFCCFGNGLTDLAEDTICVKEKDRHMHLDKHMISRFFVIHKNHFHKMEPGNTYSLQDITQHQGLPKVVCTVSTKQTVRDEIPVPNVFRMIKVISDRVTLAYSMSESNHPRPEDLIELSSYSQELYAIAESSRVTMDDIREHHSVMAVRRAIAGRTISQEDFQEISRKGSSFPPKLPDRPPTLRLQTSRTDSNGLLSQVQRVSLMGSSRDFGTPGTANRREDNIPTHMSPYTINLPTKDRKSILKRFSSVSTPAKRKESPSMRNILDKLHGKENDNNNNSNDKQRPRKSLRGLEIVHIIPDAPEKEVIDLSKPLFVSSAHKWSNSIKNSTISSTTSSQEKHSEHMDDFIHSHYEFLDNHHDNSSYHSIPCSDASGNRESGSSSGYRSSAISTRSVVRFSGVTTQPSRSHTPSSDSNLKYTPSSDSNLKYTPSSDSNLKYTPSSDSNLKSENQVSGRRSLRESMARNSIQGSGAQQSISHTKNSNDFSVATKNAANQKVRVTADPAQDYSDLRPTVKWQTTSGGRPLSGSQATSGNKRPSNIQSPVGGRPPIDTRLSIPYGKLRPTSPIRPPSSAKTSDDVSEKPTNHLLELKNRFNANQNGGLKSPTEHSPNDTVFSKETVSSKESIELKGQKPISIIDELRMRFDSHTSLQGAPDMKKEMDRKPQINDVHDDTYLTPVRSSGVIKLT